MFGGYGDYFEKAQKVNGRFDWRERTGSPPSASASSTRSRSGWPISADYTHSRRDSNFDTFDFKDDIVGGKVTLLF